MSYRVVSELEFAERLRKVVEPLRGKVGVVTGPGRSGAIAAVYASHELGVPYIPPTGRFPEHLRPLLLIDTAHWTGETIRKAARKTGADVVVCVFDEPPMVRFWYERRRSA
jgi:hypothetical protein